MNALQVAMLLSLIAGGVRTRAQVLECHYFPGETIEDEARKLCCDEIEKVFDKKWSAGGHYLTTYLAVLRSWRCPQFEQECANPTFAYTEFTKLVYMHECNATQLEQHCLHQVTESVIKYAGNVESAIHGNMTSSLSWPEVTKNLNSMEMSTEDLLVPCMQLAVFDSERAGHGRFHEIVQPFVPFCGFVWCGFDADVVNRRHVSPWTCMPQQ